MVVILTPIVLMVVGIPGPSYIPFNEVRVAKVARGNDLGTEKRDIPLYLLHLSYGI